MVNFHVLGCELIGAKTTSVMLCKTPRFFIYFLFCFGSVKGVVLGLPPTSTCPKSRSDKAIKPANRPSTSIVLTHRVVCYAYAVQR